MMQASKAERCLTVDERMLWSTQVLAVALLTSPRRESMVATSQGLAWLTAIEVAGEEIKQAGWFTVTKDGTVVLSSAMTGVEYNVSADGEHLNCSAYDSGKPCRHLALLHLINLYMAASKLPALKLPNARPAAVAVDLAPASPASAEPAAAAPAQFANGTRDVFAHRPAQPQGPARRVAFDLSQAKGGEW